MNLALCIPTYCGETELRASLPSLLQIRTKLHRALVIDSSSSDHTCTLMRNAGFEVKTIPSADFDHGGTRQLGVEMLSDCDIIIFLTQDAIPTSPESIDKLVSTFDDPKVAIAYGRQLPRPQAKPIEAHARLFSYPAQSRIKTPELISELGLRTAVVSNSFAAYRRSTLIELGGFPSGTLFGEDTLTGAKAIMAGYKIAYVGDATVYHSHGYTLAQEFRRYFDNGAFYSREQWIIQAFGKAEGSGKAYIISELKYLFKLKPWLIPLSLITAFVKFFGYKVGSAERFFPAKWKLHFSMNAAYWRREIASRK